MPENLPASSSPTDSSTPPASRGSRGRRWLLGLLIVCGLVVGGIWFLPDMVARTALRQEVPKILFPSFKGKVQLGETSLSWNSPVVVKEVRIADEAGEPLMSIGEVRSSATLWQLATNSTTLGRFDLQNLAARLVADPAGTNFDKTIADFMAAPGTGNARPFELVALGARILVAQLQSDETSTLPPMDVHLQVGTDAAKGISLELTTKDAANERSSLNLKAVSPDQAGADRFEITLQAEEWQLAQFAPLLNVWRHGGELWGELSGTATVTAVHGTAASWLCATDLQLKDLKALHWPELNGDQLEIEAASLVSQLSVADRVVDFQKFQLISSVAELTADGAVRLPDRKTQAQLRSGTRPELVTSLLNDDFALAGWVDAARIAQQLPNTLQLKSGTQISEGRLRWEFARSHEGDQRLWTGTADLSRLAATIEGTAWEWDSPLTAKARLSEQDTGLNCELLEIHSDFLDAEMQGTIHQGRLKATANLDRLSDRVSALLKQDQVKLTGTMDLDASIATDESNRVKLVAHSQFDRLQVGPDASPYWSEPKLTADLTALGTGPAHAPWEQLETADLSIQANDDRLALKLLQPAAWTTANARIPLQGELQGDLQRWSRRLQPFVETDLTTLRGQGTASLKVLWSPDEIVVEKAVVTGKSVQWSRPDWQIRSEELTVQTQGTWRTAEQTWTSPETTVNGSFGRLVWQNGTYAAASRSPVPLAGDIQFDVDVGQISQWRAGAVESHLLGTARGILRCQPTADAFTFSTDTTLERAIYATLQPIGTAGSPGGPIPAKWVATWKEPRVQLQTQGRYTGNASAVELRNLSVSGDGFRLTGELQSQQPVAGMLQFQTKGAFDYDWARLSQRMDPELAQKLTLNGAGSRPFALQGRWQTGTDAGVVMAANELQGNIGIGWSSARLLGLTLGPAEIDGTFNGNGGQIRPLDLTIAEGRVHLAPQFSFQPGATVLTLPAGRIVDQVRLSPELCRDSLKYVTPLLADATQIDGRFSLDLTEAAWPIGNVAAGRTTGSLEIYQAQLIPGGTTTKLLAIVEQVRSIVQQRTSSNPVANRVQLQLPAQTVQFRQANGRVMHDRLILRTPDVEIQTRGSVGFDESLDLVASIPISESWISDEKVRQALGGQTIQVPIRGTLQQPQIDPGVLGELARRAAGNAVNRVLEGRLQDQLNRLFPR